MPEGDAARRKLNWDWLLWWRIDQAELDKQVTEYDDLSFLQSMRGISVVCLAVSLSITAALAGFGALGLDASAYIDSAIMAVLALFIYFGHRWANISAMVLWTAEKVLTLVDGLGPTHVGSGLFFGQFLWWAAYMHAFYFSFRIEQKRRTVARAAPAQP
jgi:uncharacterized membrane protein